MMQQEVLFVDGYNMIGAWPELAQLKKQELLADARDLLLDKLSNYAKFEGIETIVVFDAQLVPGIQKSYKKYDLTVVFTKEEETADTFIEREAALRNNRRTHVRVATSDMAEQWVIFSQGALRMSARELYKNVEQADKNIQQTSEQIRFQNYRRNSPWDDGQMEELQKKLEELSD